MIRDLVYVLVDCVPHKLVITKYALFLTHIMNTYPIIFNDPCNTLSQFNDADY